MPRIYASALSQFRRRARAVLADLRREISARETELRELRDEERRLARVAGRVALPSSSARLSASSGRVNWRQVLAKLPKEFRTSDLPGGRGEKTLETERLENKRNAFRQIFYRRAA